jgi:hypothetical protein
MKTFGLNRPAGLALFAMAALLVAGSAFATPTPNSAVLHTRIWNDCPISVLTLNNSYPVQILIDDQMDPACLGYANFHNWSFSVDGVNPVDFQNNSNFHYGFDFILGGTGFGEGGLRVAPWWGLETDGKFMVNSVSGEVACFGGRLPFYSFTVNHGVTYVKGTPIHMEVIYWANGLNAVQPATIEYRVAYGGSYSSGPIAFDQGNPAEDPPHGVWGMLQPSWLGGWVQPYASQSAGGNVHAEWNNIFFDNLDPQVPVEQSTWGRLKSMYQ